MNPGQVTAVIPNWNGAANLSKLLQSLQGQTQPAAQILVIDNGSTDDSFAAAKQAGALVIALGSNRGFAYAVNRGIEAATGPWIAVINNDVELAPAWLATLIGEAEARGAWFATGKLLGLRGQIDGTYDAICRGACSWRCGAGRADGPQWTRSRTIQLAPFTAAVFRAKLFERIGMLDEDYGSYLEDVDFGLRCALSGLSGLYVPNALGHHQGSATLGRWHSESVRQIARNQVLLIAKHYPSNWIARYGWPVLIAQALWGVVALRHGAGLAFVKGKLDGLRSFGPMRRATSGAISDLLQEVLQQSEQEIHELQNATGFDPYWRLYFALTCGLT